MMPDSFDPDVHSTEPPKGGTSARHPAVQRQELRRFLRFRLEEARATVYVKGFLTSIGLGRANKARAAVNLSEGGMLVQTSEALEVGSQVQVRIELEKHEDSIESSGVVRWCFQSARSSKDYYAGIMFKNLPPLEAKKIAQMREWFTSPEYKTRAGTRMRKRPQGS